MPDPRTMTPLGSTTQPRLADELAVPAFVIGAAVTRRRRATAHARRLPGLSLLVVGALRGIARVANPHIPALPWSTGLSPWLLWGRASPTGETAAQVSSLASGTGGGPVAALATSRRDLAAIQPGGRTALPADSRRDIAAIEPGGRTALSAAAMAFAARSMATVSAPVVRGGVDAVAGPGRRAAGDTAPPARLPTSQGGIAAASRPWLSPGQPAESSGSTSTPRASAPSDAEHTAPASAAFTGLEASAPGLEAIAPALVLVRSTLCAAPRAAAATTTAAPGAVLAARRADRRIGGLLLDVSARAAGVQPDRQPPGHNAQVRTASDAGAVAGPVRRATGETAPPAPLPTSQGSVTVASRPWLSPGQPADSSGSASTPRASAPSDAEHTAPASAAAAVTGLEASAHGLEAIAPARVLVRSALGAAPRAAAATTTAVPGGVLAARRVDRRIGGLLLDVSARAARVQTDRHPPGRGAPPRTAGDAAPPELPALAAPSPGATGARRTATDALPGTQLTLAAPASPRARVVHAPEARRASVPEPLATRDARFWSTSAIASSNASSIAPSIAPAEQDLPPLPAREPGGGPVALATLVEVTRMVRTWMARETPGAGDVREARRDSSHAEGRPARPAARAIATDDDARMLLRRMRTLAQEERFRSGLLR